MAYKEIKREEIPSTLLQAIAHDDKLRIVSAKHYQVSWDYKTKKWVYLKYEDNHIGEK
jgi:hypothetical protein